MRHLMTTKLAMIVAVVLTANYALAMPETFTELLKEGGFWVGEAQYFRGGREASKFPYATQIVDSGTALKSLKRTSNDPYQNYVLSPQGLAYELSIAPNKTPVTGILDQFEEIENGWKFSGRYGAMTIDFIIEKINENIIEIKTLWNGKLHAQLNLRFVERLH